MDYISLKAVPVKQKIGMFFLTKMKPEDVLYLSRNDMSRYENTEKGIQRNISKQRQNEIHKYILNDPEATFPNSIILSVSNDFIDPEYPNYKIEDNGDFVNLEILRTENVITILDGQHRMSGLEGHLDFEFEIPVSIFIDPPLSMQAKIFAKVNGTQVKVPNDLVYDLFGITKYRSTAKTAYSIVKHLNEDSDSAWKGDIKTLTDRNGFMAQGSFAKYIDKELISENKVLRKLYDEDRDEDILIILKNYFAEIELEFSSEWKSDNKKIILQKTTGFVGVMKYFIDLVNVGKIDNVKFTRDFFKKYISGSRSKFKEMVNDNYPAGAKGQTDLYREFKGHLESIK